jgi:hypothetical protein
VTGERRQLDVLGNDGIQTVDATIATEPPWGVRLDFPDGHLEQAQGPDLFEALQSVRRKLQDAGMLLCCQGCRPDVFPSGMSRQMGGGRRAYHHRPGQQATMDDLVDIFEPADCADVVTVEQHREAMERMYDR